MTGGGLTLTRITIAFLFLVIVYLTSRMMQSKAGLVEERQKNEYLKRENKLLKEMFLRFKDGEVTKEQFIKKFQSAISKDKK